MANFIFRLVLQQGHARLQDKAAFVDNFGFSAHYLASVVLFSRPQFECFFCPRNSNMEANFKVDITKSPLQHSTQATRPNKV